MNLEKYIGLKHNYGTIDCITLVRLFYEQELSIKINLPEYPHNRRWMHVITANQVDYWAKQCAQKVLLTQAKNYDLIVFKSNKSNIITHFGIFIMPNRMLHIEEGKLSCIDTISSYWVQCLYAVYRHNDLV